MTFRRKMLMETPWAFASTPDDDLALDPAHVQRSLAAPESAVVAIEAPNDSDVLIAAAGILRMTSPKFSHRSKLWGVFVDPQYRRRGLGRAVTAAAIEVAKGWSGVEYVDLGVSSNSPEARTLYTSLGFEEWGREPETTKHDGQRFDEIFMALRIRGSALA